VRKFVRAPSTSSTTPCVPHGYGTGRARRGVDRRDQVGDLLEFC
jgi:hypothetical protein